MINENHAALLMSDFKRLKLKGIDSRLTEKVVRNTPLTSKASKARKAMTERVVCNTPLAHRRFLPPWHIIGFFSHIPRALLHSLGEEPA
jgi:hypothetical protein